MARLTDSERRDIVRALTVEAASNKVSKDREAYSHISDAINKHFVPKDLYETWLKYPKSIRTHSVYIKDVGYVLNIIQYDIDKDGLKSTLKRLEEEFEKIREREKSFQALKNKIKCALIKITTHKRLMNEFPEAYSALMGVSVDDECTDVEAIRAELNSIKK